MLADHFDRWTQNFDTRIARRSLSGVILAALVGVELAADAEAKKKEKEEA